MPSLSRPGGELRLVSVPRPDEWHRGIDPHDGGGDCAGPDKSRGTSFFLGLGFGSFFVFSFDLHKNDAIFRILRTN